LIIERIDEKKLMIMLEEQDMNSLELTYDKVSWKNQKFKVLVAKLLALAKFKTGFSVDENKLSIETMPQGSGCVLIFTLSAEKDPRATDENTALIPYETIDLKSYIYKFDNIDDLLEVCEKIQKMQKTGIKSSTIFYMNNTYFVLLYPDELILPEAVSVLLNEYGNEVEYSRIFEANLHEFGQLIHSKDAVLSLGKRSN
jgi:Negative regulator of genetic competence, sporulation and motility